MLEELQVQVLAHRLLVLAETGEILRGLAQQLKAVAVVESMMAPKELTAGQAVAQELQTLAIKIEVVILQEAV